MHQKCLQRSPDPYSWGRGRNKGRGPGEEKTGWMGNREGRETGEVVERREGRGKNGGEDRQRRVKG